MDVRFRHRWLDRAWLSLVAAAFLLLAPIWLILMVERFGLRFVIGGIALALIIRYFPSLR
jgi:hypothetical protein